MKLSIVFCCNERGICRGVVDCIRIYAIAPGKADDARYCDCLLDLVCDDRPPVYRYLGHPACSDPGAYPKSMPAQLKIGRHRLDVFRHRLFGGSWNADEAEITPHEAARLVNYLRATKKWRCEAGVQKLFDYFNTDIEICSSEIEEAARA